MDRCSTIGWSCKSPICVPSHRDAGDADYHADDSEETETIVTDPSPVAHLRVGKAKLVPKPDHVVPTVEEMKRLIGLDQPREHSTARSEHGSEDVEEDEDDDEMLLHSNLLDGESQEMVRVLQVQSALAEEDGLDFSMEELKVSGSETASPDIVRVNQQGRWFSAVVELSQEVGEPTGDLMRRHFSSLEGEFSFALSRQFPGW